MEKDSNSKVAIIGAKGGGSQRTPVEAPDSLRSTSFARILDLVSEGEIVGPVNGLKSIYLDETPVMNEDGSLNFNGVQIEYRSGAQMQEPVTGFDFVENEIRTSVEITPALPWTRTFTNPELDAVRVRLSTPVLTKTNTENGDIEGSVVKYAIDMALDGGAFQVILESQLNGKTTTKYERGHVIDLPGGASSWTIRVRRITPEPANSSIQDKIYIESFAELIEAKMRYPNSALVGTIVDAEHFQNIPVRAFHMKGRIIRVPTNYDPTTRTYTGIWDGTFKPHYSNNPAWVFYDLVTNKRYGLGRLVDESMLNKWSLYKIARYCDEMVSNGKGGLEPRFTANLYLQTRAEAYKVLQDLTSIFRGIAYWAGGAIVASADMPEDPVYVYNQANVVEGKFTYQGSPRKSRSTVALVSWNDMSDFGRAKVEYVEDREGIERYGIQMTEVTAIGCTSQAAAHRAGRWLLYTSRMETDSVSFSVGLDGAIAAPGQIILVADEHRAGVRLGGRIVSATSTSLTVDATPAVSPGDSVIAVLPDGGTVSKVVQSVSGRVITMTTPYDVLPMRESAWTFSSLTVVPQHFRVMGVVENEDGTYGITAIEHNPGKFAAIEQGIELDERPITRLPGTVLLPPTNITIDYNEVVGEVDLTRANQVAWNVIEGATKYKVKAKSNSGNWVDYGEVRSNSIDISDMPPGKLQVSVTAVGPTGMLSKEAISAEVTIPDFTQRPKAIERNAQDIAAEVTARADAILAEANARAAALLQEQQDRAAAIAAEAVLRQSGDTNEATERLALAAQMRGAYTGTDLNSITQGLLFQERTARASADSAIASSVTALTTRVSDAETGITNQGSALSALTTRVTNAEGVNTSQSDSITNLSNAISVAGAILRETHEGASAASRWTSVASGAGEMSIETVADAPVGGKVFRVGNNSGNDQRWVEHGQLIPFDPNKLYRVRFRVRRVAGTSNGVYMGVTAFAADGTTRISTTGSNTTSNAHYAFVNQLPTLGEFVEYECYYKGLGNPGVSGTGTRASPRSLYAGARYFRPMMILNYNAAAGITEVNTVIVEDADALGEVAAQSTALSALTTRVSDAEGTISSQSLAITSLQTTVGNQSTSITQIQESLDGVEARWGVVIDANGRVTGVSLIGSESTSAFRISATNFELNSPVDNELKVYYNTPGYGAHVVNPYGYAEGMVVQDYLQTTAVIAERNVVRSRIEIDGLDYDPTLAFVGAGDYASASSAGIFFRGKIPSGQGAYRSFRLGLNANNELTFNQTTLGEAIVLTTGNIGYADGRYIRNMAFTNGSIASGVDLNTVVAAGVYHQSTNANAAAGTNYPTAHAGMLEVYAYSSMVYQRYTKYDDARCWIRANYAGTWSPWRQVISNADLSFTPVQQGGGVGQFANKVYIGWTGNSLNVTVDSTDQGALAFRGLANTFTNVNVFTGGYLTNRRDIPRVYLESPNQTNGYIIDSNVSNTVYGSLRFLRRDNNALLLDLNNAGDLVATRTVVARDFATRFGAVGTQVIMESWAHSDGVARYYGVLEGDGAYSIYLRTSAGATAPNAYRKLGIDLDAREVVFGDDGIRWNGNLVWHAGNLTPGSLTGNGDPSAPAGYGMTVSGSFGGGYRMVDGSIQSGIYSTSANSGTVNVAIGTSTSLTTQFAFNAAGDMLRRNANSSTMTRQPRTFVGGSDPGAAAADGDLWIS